MGAAGTMQISSGHRREKAMTGNRLVSGEAKPVENSGYAEIL